MITAATNVLMSPIAWLAQTHPSAMPITQAEPNPWWVLFGLCCAVVAGVTYFVAVLLVLLLGEDRYDQPTDRIVCALVVLFVPFGAVVFLVRCFFRSRLVESGLCMPSAATGHNPYKSTKVFD